MASASDVSPEPPRRHTRPIAFYLFALALVVLLPSFAFSAILLQRNNQAQERVVEALISGTTRSIMQAVERELAANISTLKVLATTEDLQAGNYRGFYDRAKLALAGSDTYVYLLDANFYSLVSTRGEFGVNPVLSNDIASAKLAIERKNIVVSDLVFGKVLRRWVFNIVLPRFDPPQAPTIIGLSRNAEDLASALLSDKLPDGWNVAMVDSKAKIIAASPGAGATGARFELADPDSLIASPQLLPLQSGGENYVTAVRSSFLTGWTLVAWAPRAVITRPLVDAVWSLAVGGVLLAAVVILVVYWVTLAISRSVQGLAADAKLLGGGLPIPPRKYPISEIAAVSLAIEDASRRRVAADAEVRFLMRELAHRSKNQMTVIAAMAKQTARGADSVPEFVQAFEKRIFGLARATDLLLANVVIGVDFGELLAGQIEPFCPLDGGRVELSGAPLRLNNQAAQILGMAAHELATNAVKHGALAAEKGKLRVAWERNTELLTLTWRETLTATSAALSARRDAADAAKPQERRGFGTTVLENMVGRSLNAEVTRTMHADGIEWTFKIPLAGLDPAVAPEEAETAASNS